MGKFRAMLLQAKPVLGDSFPMRWLQLLTMLAIEPGLGSAEIARRNQAGRSVTYADLRALGPKDRHGNKGLHLLAATTSITGAKMHRLTPQGEAFVLSLFKAVAW
jgi:hypothetical protein